MLIIVTMNIVVILVIIVMIIQVSHGREVRGVGPLRPDDALHARDGPAPAAGGPHTDWCYY